MRIALLVAVSFAACSPPVCDPVDSAPQSVCHRADAGTISADAPFTLEGTTFVRGGACQVSVDGGQLQLLVSGTEACGGTSGSGAFAPQAPTQVACAIPALPAGTYSVNSGTPLTFTIPESADAGVPNCL
jgi:hypothetical protein